MSSMTELHHSHTANEAIVRLKEVDVLPHSHSDLSNRVKPNRARHLIRIDPNLLSSAASLTWAGSQAHIGRHVSTDRLDKGEEEGGEGILAPTGRLTVPLALVAFVAAFGSSLPHGWNTGVLNLPGQHIRSFLNETFSDRFGYIPSDQLLNLLWSLSVSIYLVGGCGGAFAAGTLANKLGRKGALLLCNVFGFVSALLFGLCDFAGSFEMLILARLIVGFGCGAGSGLVPMFLTEISPVNIRGSMGVLHQLALTVGILLSQVFGLNQILGQEHLWPYLLALTAVPCLVSVCLLPCFPESPRYLYVNKEDDKAAEKALQKYRGEDDVSLDLAEMKAEHAQQEKEPEWTFIQLFRTHTLRMQLALVCVLAVAQQLSGINVVFYYSTGVFIEAGIPEDYVQYASLAAGFINVLMTVISVVLMDKVGRRKLLLSGMIIMVGASVLMTLSLSLKDKASWISYFSIVAIIAFVIGFAIGLGSIPQFIGAELFKQGPRPPAMSFAGLLNWLSNVIVGITFPLMAPYTGAYSFIPFIVITLLFGAFLWWKLPETKGKTYDEIWRFFVKDDKEMASPETTGLLDSTRRKNQDNNAERPAGTELMTNGVERLSKQFVTDHRLYSSSGVL